MKIYIFVVDVVSLWRKIIFKFKLQYVTNEGDTGSYALEKYNIYLFML